MVKMFRENSVLLQKVFKKQALLKGCFKNEKMLCGSSNLTALYFIA